ncbi:MAG: copper resistance protein CopC, partial [Alphaproteobacteria bacterium]|nr:copper resistance protein CopC [Alphaproteobacteria bacterium]
PAPARGVLLPAAPVRGALRSSDRDPPAAIRWVGPGGPRDLGARAENDSVMIDLPADLPAGGYYLVWRVASADTHPIAGTISFAIGDAALPAPPPDAGAHAFDPRTPAAMFVRFARDLALAIGVGGFAFPASAHAGCGAGPGQPRDPCRTFRRARRRRFITRDGGCAHRRFGAVDRASLARGLAVECGPRHDRDAD